MGTENSLKAESLPKAEENQKLLPYPEVIKLAKQAGVDFGKGYPYNRLRYYTKIGLLPKAHRRSFGGPAEGCYPSWVVDKLIEIDRQLKQGQSVQSILRQKSSTPSLTNALSPAPISLYENRKIANQEDFAQSTDFGIGEQSTYTESSAGALDFIRRGALYLGLMSIIFVSGLATVYEMPQSHDNVQSLVNIAKNKFFGTYSPKNLIALPNQIGSVLGRTTAPYFKVNVPTEITHLLSAFGGIKTNGANANLGKGKLTASNVIYDVLPGTNVSISSGQKPTISVSGLIGSVNGTAGRITSSGGDNPTIDIASNYTGQTSIDTVGTIGSGVWHGSPLTDPYVSNNITVSNYLPLSGGTLTGSLTLNNNDGGSGDVNLILGDSNESGDIVLNNSGFTGAITSGALTAARVWTLPNETGTICTTTSGCGAAGVLFDIAADAGANQSVTAGDTVTLTGGAGISTSVAAGPTATFDVNTGNGVQISADAVALGPLTADWDQTGAFNIYLDNAGSNLQIRENGGGADKGIFDVASIAGDQTYTFTTGGTVWTSGNDGSGSTLDADTLDSLDSSQFLRSDTSDSFTSGTLTFDNGTTLTVNGVANIGDGGDAVAISGTTVSVTANGAGNDITLNLVDNNTDALDIKQGADNYININTTNTTENISFGNAATNPTYSFLGSGTATFSGATTVTGTLTANGSFVANNTFTLGDGGDTGSINTSDWAVSTTGDMTGIGSIGADGDITTSQATPSVFLTDTTAASDDYSINADASTFTIRNETDARDDVSIDGSGNVTLNSVGSFGNGTWSFSSAGALSGVTTISTSSTITLGALGATDTTTLLCRNSGNVIAGCNSGSGSGQDADLLDGLDSSQFLRSDTSDNFTSGTLTTDAGTTLAVAGDLTIADNNIPLTGGDTTIDLNAAATRTLTITNSNGANVANLSVEGTATAADFSCSDCIALTTETSGDYVANVDTSVLTGLTGGSAGSEGASLSLAFDYSQALSGDVGLGANAAVFGQSGFVFEGATANTFETFLAVTDPTGDRTITFPDAGGTVCLSGQTCATSGTVGYWSRTSTALSPATGGDTVDMAGAIISNIGNTATDFDTGGGLTLAGNLVVQGTTGLTFNTGAGGDITFANGEKIDNDTDGTVAITGNGSISGHAAIGGSASISTAYLLTIQETTSVAGSRGINLAPTFNPSASTIDISFNNIPTFSPTGGITHTVEGQYNKITVGGSATIPVAYGVAIDTPTISGSTVTNLYGLYVANQTGATNNYAAVFAGGNVGIGTTAPNQLLHLSSSGSPAEQFTSTAAPSQGANGGSTFSDDSSIGTVTWGSPSNAQTNDASYANATLASTEISHYLKATDFAFTVPATATITGISVSVVRKISGGCLCILTDNSIKLVKGGTISGDNKADTGTAWTTSDVTATYGNSSDLWGLSLAPSDVNASNFGVAVSATNTIGSAIDADINYISITVYYTYNSWVAGLNTSDSGNFNISNYTAFGTNDYFRIGSFGNLAVGAGAGSGNLVNQGLFSYPTFSGGATSCAFGCTGVFGKGKIDNTSNNNIVIGVGGQVETAATSFTLTNAIALFANSPLKGSGSSITNSYGLDVQNQDTVGVTTSYGVYIENQTGTGTNYGLYVVGADTDAIYTAAGSNKFVFATGDNFSIDASTTAQTQTAGTLDLNINAGNATVTGLNVDFIANTGITAATDEVGAKINLTQNDANADMFGLQINQLATSVTIGGGDLVECLLCLDNAENQAAAVTDAIRITNSGGTANAITNDINLQNGETIDNKTNGTIALTATTTSLSGVLSIDGTSGTAISVTNTGITTDISLQNGETIDNNTDGTISLGTTTTLTASGALTISTGSNGVLTLSPNGTGNVVISGTTTGINSALDVTKTTSSCGFGCFGVLARPLFTTTESIANAVGGQIRTNTGAALTTASALLAGGPNITAGTITTANGLYVQSQGSASTTTAIGIYLEPMTGSTNNYGICFDCDGTFGTQTVASGIRWGTDGTAANNINAYRSANGQFTIDNGTPTTLFQVSTTANLLNLDDTTSRTERLCHGAGNGGTGTAAISDCSGTPGDYAEQYGTSDPSIEAGDLVVVDTDQPAQTITNKDGQVGSKAWVLKSSEAYQTSLIGVVSTSPNEVIGQNFTNEENPRPITLSGRVPVKVSTENGPIEAGDPITSSSTPGVAMKATASGPIIGKALEPYNESGVGKIIAIIQVGWYVAPLGSGQESGQSSITGVTDLALNSLTANTIILGSNQISLDQYGNLQINGNLALSGNEQISGNLDLTGSLTASSINTGELKISDKSSGSSSINAGGSTVIINNNVVTGNSKVLVTFNSDWAPADRFWVSKASGSFIVHVDKPVSTRANFDWIVVN